ncbi:MAG: ABC transporter substrate-binding protein [Acetobacteraceae bacterium]|nr:ABC transporter substrate-binding protein [Acetobacteraceae bacterium]
MSGTDGRIGDTLGRRGLLSGVAAGVLAAGMPAQAAPMPKRGGTLRFGTRVDGSGLDPHRNLVYYVSDARAATTQGLLDLNQKMEVVPAVAQEWEISKDLKKYTFRLRRGVEFHNGASVDAAAVKWNYERIMDPKFGHAFSRASLEDIERIEADGKEVVHIHLKEPSAVFLGNLVYYPCNLMAPNSVGQADTHPVGCGPFKFVSWKRYAKSEMVRFENYFEMGADGKALPYLDALEGYPKREDKVRLTALRSGEVDLIDNMAYSDVAAFKRDYAKQLTTWDVAQVGMAHLNINAKSGPFAMDAPNGKLLRQAVAHAIDRTAIHEAVFNGLGEPLNTFYASSSPWHMAGVKNAVTFDPEKSRFILRKLNMMGMPIAVVAREAFQYMRNSGELVHSMLMEAGFKASNEVFDEPVLRDKYRKNDWGIDSTATSYRFEPDGWYSRWLHSDGAEGKLRLGFKNEKVDKLIEAARLTLDRGKRMEMYTDVDNIVNDEAALIYSHAVPLTGAGTKRLQGYAPAIAGPFTWAGGGVRTAWFDNTPA